MQHLKLALAAAAAAVFATSAMAAEDLTASLPDPLKALGETSVPVKLHRDVTAQVRVAVVKEE